MQEKAKEKISKKENNKKSVNKKTITDNLMTLDSKKSNKATLAPTKTKSDNKKTKAVKSNNVKSTKKPSVKKDSLSKVTNKKSPTSPKTVDRLEYYDLPSIYNKTIVKILAQTPFCLFVYWEVSEHDKEQLQKQYGENIFNISKPYLIVTNETQKYCFEIEINDYANSWYIHIKDSDNKYRIDLIRKFIDNKTFIEDKTINIISSNQIDSPNDHILFDRLGKYIFFRNIKTNSIKSKNIESISFLTNLGKIYNIYDFYKEIYQNELKGDELGINLPSSQFSSDFK